MLKSFQVLYVWKSSDSVDKFDLWKESFCE